MAADKDWGLIDISHIHNDYGLAWGKTGDIHISLKREFMRGVAF
jgi:hypothetical protein